MPRFASMALATAAALVALPSPAPAGEPAVRLGEVTAEAAAREDVDVATLRAMAAEALASIDGASLPAGTHAVLSVSLVRLESRASSPAEVACQVSATLREEARGAIFAILDGSARGQDEPRHLAALERATLRAAVGSAVARVPEAVRRRRH